MTPGLDLRLRRLRVPGTDVYLTVPLDHGISMGPVRGIIDLPDTLDKVTRGGASCVLTHKGNARFVPPYADRLGFCMHISAGTASNPDPNDKVLITTVEEAIGLGADAISTHTNFGAPTESQQLYDLGRTVTEAHRYGLPVLSMAYPRGPAVTNPYDVELVKGASRAAAECGADLVKTVYTGDPETFKEVVQGCPVPLLVAGGPRAEDDTDLLEMLVGTRDAGAKGVSIGRNVFQHEHPDRMVAAIRTIFVDGSSLEEAVRHLESPLPA